METPPLYEDCINHKQKIQFTHILGHEPDGDKEIKTLFDTLPWLVYLLLPNKTVIVRENWKEEQARKNRKYIIT